jgi:hypothetical protein
MQLEEGGEEGRTKGQRCTAVGRMGPTMGYARRRGGDQSGGEETRVDNPTAASELEQLFMYFVYMPA